MRPARRAATVLLLLAILAAGGLPAGPTHAQPLPDLFVDAGYLQLSLFTETRTFLDGDCAVQEGAIPAGTHTLVRFGTKVVNGGDADLNLDKPRNHNAPDPDYEWFPCHHHWHFTTFAEYRLVDAAGAVVGTGHKQSFCLLDYGWYYDWAPHQDRPRYTCANQGISRGWFDLYDPWLDGQWVVIDGVPPGTYTLEVEVNYAGVLAEADYGNNVATAVVTIPDPAVGPGARSLLGE